MTFLIKFLHGTEKKVHQANPYYTSCVLVSNSTTQCHLSLSSYRIRILKCHLVLSSHRITPLSAIWRCPHTKPVFSSSTFWVIRPSCTTTRLKLYFCERAPVDYKVIREKNINLLMNLVWTAC